MSSTPTTINRGLATRQEFGANEQKTQAELAAAAVSSREEAVIKAEYVMAERHPRVWMNVRTQMKEHCTRLRFAEVARYAKPVGRKNIGGRWVDEYARGWSARFAETSRKKWAMSNPSPRSRMRTS